MVNNYFTPQGLSRKKINKKVLPFGWNLGGKNLYICNEWNCYTPVLCHSLLKSGIILKENQHCSYLTQHSPSGFLLISWVLTV
jgi:hypothetical protein